MKYWLVYGESPFLDWYNSQYIKGSINLNNHRPTGVLRRRNVSTNTSALTLQYRIQAQLSEVNWLTEQLQPIFQAQTESHENPWTSYLVVCVLYIYVYIFIDYIYISTYMYKNAYACRWGCLNLGTPKEMDKAVRAELACHRTQSRDGYSNLWASLWHNYGQFWVIV